MKRSILFVVASCAALVVVLLVMNRGEGVTPLMRAAKAGNTVEIEELVNGGAEVDEHSRYGWTALMFAAWQGHEDVVEALLGAGADPNIVSGAVPSGFETVGGHPPSSALQEAVRNDHLTIAKTLISAGADIDAGTVALSARSGDVELLKLLKAQGAELDASSGNAFYATPLCAAAASGKIAVVRWLVENGADPNQVAVRQTALKEAVDNDELEIVDYLLRHGADPNLVYGSTDETALFRAVTKHTEESAYPANISIIQMLLKHGADRTHRAFSGQHTALEFVQIQKANTTRYLDEATTEEVRDRIRVSLSHKNKVIEILGEDQRGEPAG